MLNILNTFFLWWGEASRGVSKGTNDERSVAKRLHGTRKFNLQLFKATKLNFTSQVEFNDAYANENEIKRKYLQLRCEWDAQRTAVQQRRQ